MKYWAQGPSFDAWKASKETFCAFCLSRCWHCVMSGLMWMSAPVISRTEKTFACLESQTHTDRKRWWKWENHTPVPSSLALRHRVMSGLIRISNSSLSGRRGPLLFPVNPRFDLLPASQAYAQVCHFLSHCPLVFPVWILLITIYQPNQLFYYFTVSPFNRQNWVYQAKWSLLPKQQTKSVSGSVRTTITLFKTTLLYYIVVFVLLNGCYVF